MYNVPDKSFSAIINKDDYARQRRGQLYDYARRTAASS